MGRRVLVAAIGIPVAFGLVFLGGWPLVGVIALLAVVGVSEFYAMARKAGAKPLPAVGYPAAILFPVVAYLLLPAGGMLDPTIALFGVVIWILAALAVATVRLTPSDQPINSVSTTIFGAMYAAGLPAFLILIRHGPENATAIAATWLVFYPLVMTWICDSMAMSGGAAIGGPKLAPVVSPNKTWAGAISGLVGALVVALGYGWLVLGQFGFALRWWHMVVLGLVVGILGQLGDLAESIFKRSVGTKDSGGFFPGHGGVLDRLDSLYFVIPVTALLLYTFGVL